MNIFEMNIKKLGFGFMRLPKNDGVIDIEQTKKMVDRFIAEGFTYFDTAFVYPGSEDALKLALVDRYPRESYQLATKNAAWHNNGTREDAIEQFHTSLRRTGAGYFDFYLLHSLRGNNINTFDELDMWNFVLEKKKEGLIKHIGFSFHGTPEELDGVLTKHPEAEFVQLQINYADWENPSVQSRACYETARKHGKPIIIMEPVKGGTLADPPENAKKLFKDADPDASYASWAIRYAAGLEGVLVVLSGMSNTEQMEDNLSYMKDFRPLNAKELSVLQKAKDAVLSAELIPCTGCNYCAEPCPMNIGISGIFTAYNCLKAYGDKGAAQNQKKLLVTDRGLSDADECIKCGACESVCPQHLEIRDILSETFDAFLK